jgi:hypothetical protein
MSLIKELRKPRIKGIAIFDLLTSFIGMALIFSYMGWDWRVGAALAVPIGIATHYVLGIDTTLNYYLGISKLPQA